MHATICGEADNNLFNGTITEINSGIEGERLHQHVVPQHGDEGHHNVHQGHVEDHRSAGIAHFEVIHCHDEAGIVTIL